MLFPTLYPLSPNIMSDSLMFNEDAYVLLETDRPEQLLTPAEMFAKLREIVVKFADDLPIDVQQITGVEQRVQYLLDTSCELDLAPGEYLQWYAVRLEK
jgi:Protein CHLORORESPIRATORY REDUCTION 7